MTEITVKLYPLPEAVSAAICSFPSIEAAVRTTMTVIQMGVPIARVELIDTATVRAVNQYAKLTLPEKPMLLMEFHGSPAGVKEQAETVQEIATEMGGESFEWATTPEERTRLWTARHNAFLLRCKHARAAKPSPPMRVCPSVSWPTACWIRLPRQMPQAFRISWWAT